MDAEIMEIGNRPKSDYLGENFEGGAGDTHLRAQAPGDPNYSADLFTIEGFDGEFLGGNINYIAVGAAHAKLGLEKADLANAVGGYNAAQAIGDVFTLDWAGARSNANQIVYSQGWAALGYERYNELF